MRALRSAIITTTAITAMDDKTIFRKLTSPSTSRPSITRTPDFTKDEEAIASARPISEPIPAEITYSYTYESDIS